MSDTYIPWWLAPDHARRADVEPQSVSGAADVEEAPPLIEMAETPEAEPAALVPIEPETPAELEAARAYVDGQGSE